MKAGTMKAPGRPKIDGPRTTLRLDQATADAIDAARGELKAAEWIRQAIRHCLQPRIFIQRHSGTPLDVITITSCCNKQLHQIHVPTNTPIDPADFGYANAEWLPTIAGQVDTTLPTEGNTP